MAWTTQTFDPSTSYTITGAPRVVKGKVIIGAGGAEYNVRGFVSAYDAETGKMVWRFYTVPSAASNDGQPSDKPLKEIAAKTWAPGAFARGDLGGGGTVWDAIVYDPDLDLLYVGAGNGSPWNQAYRGGPGDNLFLASIIALKPDTGEYVWHYQLNPGDEWDYSATQQIILADMTIDGKPRKVAMQAPKNGFFYVVDRTNGKLISAKPFAPVTWATGIDIKTGRPIENPAARYTETGKPFTGTPSPHGAHSWMPMSFDPKTGLVYIPVQDVGFTYAPDKAFEKKPMGINVGLDMAAVSMPQDPKVKTAVMDSLKGRLSAWDPVNQREVWKVEMKGPWNGGVVSTAGNLLFQGNATGEFAAYTADQGRKVWSFDAQSPVIAGPVTYTVGGEQYVAVMSGWGGTYSLVAGIVSLKSGNTHNASRVLVFKLGASGKLPPVPVAVPKVLNPAPDVASPTVIDHGFKLYSRYCGSCHGDAVVAGGITPDLRYSSIINARESFAEVVLNGALKANGMASWAPVLTPEDAEAVRAYIIHRAHQTQQQKAAGEPWTG